MNGLPAVEDIYEMDDDGYCGSWLGLHIRAHVDDETAVALAWSHMECDGREGSLTPPRRTYLRKVPSHDGMRFHYSGRGRGATPVTLMEQPHGWSYWCDVPGCRSQFVRGTAVTGIPRGYILNGADLGVQQQYRADEYAYLCRWHHKRYDADLSAARAEAMRAYYAERDAS